MLDDAIETLRFNARNLFAEDDKDDALKMLAIAREVMADVANRLANMKAGKAEVRDEALREAATTLLRQLNTVQENEKRNGSLLYHEQSPMADTIRALAAALNPGAPK